jgi:hypothetical protein
MHSFIYFIMFTESSQCSIYGGRAGVADPADGEAPYRYTGAELELLIQLMEKHRTVIRGQSWSC